MMMTMILLTKIYLYTKGINEVKYRCLNQKHKKFGLERCKNPKAFY